MNAPEVLLFHKPKAIVVSASDEHGRKTVYHALPEWVMQNGWVPVGRLDRDSRGLLLFVKEKGLVEMLGRPGALEKIYEVQVRGHVNEDHLQQLLSGIESPVGLLRCDSVEVVRVLGPRTELKVTLLEGKNRHIRRMFGALRDPERGTPLKVLELKRVQIGPCMLDVASGKWRMLQPSEVKALLSAAR